MSKKKLGLALGAGGARGIAHIGFLRVLEENNIEISCITGSSMGAVIGSLYCAGVTVDAMAERAKNIKLKELLDIDLFFFKKMGIIKGNKRETILSEYLGEKSFNECKIPFCCTAVDIINGEKLVIKEGSLLKAVMASSAIPSVFEPEELNGRKLVDGGLLTRLPIDEARTLGADVVIAVDVLGDEITEIPPKNIISTLIRTIDIMNLAIAKTSFDKADLLVTVEQPEVDQFMVKNLDKSLEAGIQAATDALPRIKALLK